MISLKKIILIFGIVSFLLVLSIFIYLKANPPLLANGVTYFSGDKMKRAVEIVNTGFANIEIKSVLVNGRKPQNVELGVSRTDHLVIGEGLEKNRYITFHNVKELKVQPEEELKRLNEKGDTQTIKHYGLRVIGKDVPEKIMIKYTYLGIPFSLVVDVTE